MGLEPLRLIKTLGRFTTRADEVLKHGERSPSNNPVLNISKSEELVLDFLQNRAARAPRCIHGEQVEQGESTSLQTCPGRPTPLTWSERPGSSYTSTQTCW